MTKRRRGVRLTPDDLAWFGQRFLNDLKGILPDLTFRLATSPDIGAPQPNEAGFSLDFKGQTLGYLYYSPGTKVGVGLNFLPELVQQGLRTMSLRKSLLTDGETGFLSRDCFRRLLTKELARRAPEGATLNLSLDEEPTPDLILVMVELQDDSNIIPDLLAMSTQLEEHLSLRYLSRLGRQRLGFLVEGRPDEIRQTLEKTLETYKATTTPVMAWSCYPKDVIGTNLEGETKRVHRHPLQLIRKARAALFHARQTPGKAAVAFSDLVDNHGQIIQVLPLDRVVINLGRSTGALPGQVFMASSPDRLAGSEPDYKGEVTIFQASEDYSVAHVTSLKASHRLVAGDRLRFSRTTQDQGEMRGEIRPLSGLLATVPKYDNFIEKLEAASQQPVALALVRLDNCDKNSSVLGQEELDRLRTFIFGKVIEMFPTTELKSFWRPDTLVLAWPGGDQTELGPLAHRVVTELKESGPVSLGMVFSAGQAESAQTLVEDGQKALNEAAFSGPGQVSVFGPLALNISGDRLFEGGDLSGAIREYDRGLALAPDHLNLLNSLGVCHGRQGQSARALETFEKIAELDPHNMMAHYNLGYTHLLAGRLLEAEESLSRAAVLAPDNFESLFHLGKTALELGHLDKAVSALKKAGRLGDGRPVVFSLLGEALLLSHDHQGALVAFKKAVKATPNDAYALSALGALFVDQANDLPVAKSLFQKSVEIDPTNSLYRQRLGRLLFSMGDFDGAEHHLTMAMEYGSRAPEVHFQLGRVAEEAGRSHEALTHFKAALEQDPAFQPALERISADLEAAGDEALPHIEQAV